MQALELARVGWLMKQSATMASQLNLTTSRATLPAMPTMATEGLLVTIRLVAEWQDQVNSLPQPKITITVGMQLWEQALVDWLTKLKSITVEIIRDWLPPPRINLQGRATSLELLGLQWIIRSTLGVIITSVVMPLLAALASVLVLQALMNIRNFRKPAEWTLAQLFVSIATLEIPWQPTHLPVTAMSVVTMILDTMGIARRKKHSSEGLQQAVWLIMSFRRRMRKL